MLRMYSVVRNHKRYEYMNVSKRAKWTLNYVTDCPASASIARLARLVKVLK